MAAQHGSRLSVTGVELHSLRAPARVAMVPPHPGAFIREEILDELGYGERGGKGAGVRRATVSDLINGNAALSAEMALRIDGRSASKRRCC